jgi:hypothetical protein
MTILPHAGSTVMIKDVDKAIIKAIEIRPVQRIFLTLD